MNLFVTDFPEGRCAKKSRSALRSPLKFIGAIFVALNGLAWVLLLSGSLTGCSSAKKKPVRDEIAGQKIALIQVEGELTARRIVEVALVNQLAKSGHFTLVPKEDVERERQRPKRDPNDSQGIAREAGADYALLIRVLSFDAADQEGYSSEKVYDSQMAAERGEEEGEVERLFKEKQLNANVSLGFEFTNVKTGETRHEEASVTGREVFSGKDQAPRLPPKLRYLERLTNEAIAQFLTK